MTQKLILAMVILPICLGIFCGAKQMGISVIAIFLALCFANLDKISRFKGAGMEAEVRTAVNDAYAAITQLKDLGLSLSSPIVDELTVSGRWHVYIQLKYKLKNVEKIAETLKKLGASDKEIEETCSTFYQRLTEDHKRAVLNSLLRSNQEKKLLFEGVNDGNMDDWDKSKLDKFIMDNDLKKNEETEDYFRDLDYFLQNKKLRREDNWQS